MENRPMTAELRPPDITPPAARTRSDVGNWAPPETARDRQSRPRGAIQGFGKLWQKTTRIRLEGSGATPLEVVAMWKAHFTEFWADGGAQFRAPLTGIAPGEVADLDFVAPGGLKLSTGIIVLYVDDESFTFMTPEGHVFAGWVTFSAFRDGDVTVAQVQVLMRAQDPIGELILTFGGHRIENRFWEQTLANLAAYLGVDAAAGTETICVDEHRQWRRAANIRQSMVIRSTLRAAMSPVRWMHSHVGSPGSRRG
jgi:hypothetical protein